MKVSYKADVLTKNVNKIDFVSPSADCSVVLRQLLDQGEGREGVETAIHRASPSVMRASQGVRRSNCKQIWLRVHDPSEGVLKLLLYKILLV